MPTKEANYAFVSIVKNILEKNKYISSFDKSFIINNSAYLNKVTVNEVLKELTESTSNGGDSRNDRSDLIKKS